MESIKIIASTKVLEGIINLPLSKSMSNRGLMISALSDGRVRNVEVSDADDTVLLDKLLTQIQAAKDHHIYCQNAGTVMRFLTAFLAITPGLWTLDGDESMRQRPIGPLVDALRSLKAEVEYADKEGYPPLKIKGKRLVGGSVTIKSTISSQYISALMMIGPLLENGLIITTDGSQVSLPYIYMTENMMKEAGAVLSMMLPEIRIKGTGYKGGVLPYETDWSSAAFWYELMVLSEGGELFLRGLKEKSVQGDRVAQKYFQMLGVETIFKSGGAVIRKNDKLSADIDFELSQQPDLAPALIVCTAAKGINGSFYGIEGLRVKESDRVRALVLELLKCGIKCRVEDDLLTFKGQKIQISQAIETYGDHRIAMAFAPLAVLGTPVIINEPGVVSKSYPNFLDELHRVLDFRHPHLCKSENI